MNGANVSISALEDPRRHARHILERSTSLPDKHKGGEFAAGLQQCSSLRTLDLSHSHLGSAGMLALAQSLCANSSVQHLDLTRCSLGKDGARAVSRVLRSNHSLQSLNLSGNSLGDGLHGMTASQKNLNLMRIMDLSLAHSGRGGAEEIAESLAVNGFLHSLNISKNSLGWNDSDAIGAAIQANKSLKTLDLSSNVLEDYGGRVIAQALMVNSSLQHLKLSSNRLAGESAEAIAVALHRNTVLKTLDLAFNDLGHNGVCAIAKELARNSFLETLDLTSNKVDEDAAIAIGFALQQNGALRCLRLCLNNLGEGGALAMVEALRINRTLTKLDVRGFPCANPLDFSEKSALAMGEMLRDTPRHNALIVDGVNFARVAQQLGLPKEAGSWSDEQVSAHFLETHRQKDVAFLMGHHARLGRSSLLHLLSEDTFPLIFGALFGVSSDAVGRRVHAVHQELVALF